MSRSCTSSPSKRRHGLSWDSFNFIYSYVPFEVLLKINLSVIDFFLLRLHLSPRKLGRTLNVIHVACLNIVFLLALSEHAFRGQCTTAPCSIGNFFTTSVVRGFKIFLYRRKYAGYFEYYFFWENRLQLVKLHIFPASAFM